VTSSISYPKFRARFDLIETDFALTHCLTRILAETARHFSGCAFFFTAQLVQKPLRTFWDALFSSPRILSKNRFTLFGMRFFLHRASYPKNRFTLFGMRLGSAEDTSPRSTACRRVILTHAYILGRK